LVLKRIGKLIGHLHNQGDRKVRGYSLRLNHRRCLTEGMPTFELNLSALEEQRVKFGAKNKAAALVI
jgi:hypothetical protein